MSSRIVVPAPQIHADYIRIAQDVEKTARTPFGLLACQCNPMLQSIRAKVLSCEEIKGKKKTPSTYEIVLSDTVIIPTGGGQPHDTGRIGEAVVTDVIRRGFDPVHIADRAVEVGLEVDVTLDWSRRLDHMIQHTAQHLISAVFEREQLDTGSWSLSAFPQPSYIELPRAPTLEQIQSVEDQCNALIAANVRCHVDVKSGKSAPKMDSLPDSMPEGGAWRTVFIGGLDGQPLIDENPCGGTHLPSLGQMNSIHILPTTSSIRGGHARVFFLAGSRVTAFTRAIGDSARAVANEIGCAVDETPERTAQLNASAKDSFRRATKLQELLAARDAQAFVSSLPENGVGLLVLRQEVLHDLSYLKLVINQSLDLLGSRPSLTGVLSTIPKAESPLMIAGDSARLATVAARLKAELGQRWKGGGRDRVQGKLSTAFSDADIAIVRGALESA